MTLKDYPSIEIIIDGNRFGIEDRSTRAVLNPANNEKLAEMPDVTPDDLKLAVASSQAAFQQWKNIAPLDRSNILRKFAELLRKNEQTIARNLTLDMGKPLAESLAEIRMSAAHVEWNAEEGRRLYGRVIPSRDSSIQQIVSREPIGVCLAISPWNFPLQQAVRKVAGALASGCTMLLKGPTDTPSSIMAIANLLEEAGLPKGCLNILWGDSQLISETLLADPIVKKISFTGSVPVGKILAELAGQHMKRATMELGGHAPVLVFDDADAKLAAQMLAVNKLRNAGQVCISPTRFFVQQGVYETFTTEFVDAFEKIKIGNGLDEGTQLGPLCHPGRISAMESLVNNARESGANILTGGERVGNEGLFYAPTIVECMDDSVDVMHEEPFGPIAALTRFTDPDDAMRRANSLPFGLASYVFTNSLERADWAAAELQAGMVSINHFGLAQPETPFGGINDSGYGSEGGIEGLDSYVVTKFVSRMSKSAA